MLVVPCLTENPTLLSAAALLLFIEATTLVFAKVRRSYSLSLVELSIATHLSFVLYTLMFLKVLYFFLSTKSTQPKSQNPCFTFYRYCHGESNIGLNDSSLTPTLSPKKPHNNVAIFWDLDNKPPNSLPPYEAAVKLRKAVSSFGIVKYMVAYANQHAFSYVPQVVKEQRKERKLLNQLENKGLIKPVESYLCKVCGRKFYNNDKLMNHFKQIHQREQQKRLNQIESARGKRRVNLVGKYAMKMQKYKNAVKDVLTPKVGYGLADELKRAGFWVRAVSNKPQAADVALRDHMVDLMDKRRADCLVLVSDDSDFVDVLKQAKLRCLRTVVVGDIKDGPLKRVADTGFSWQEILMGKAQKEAVSVLGRWKDRDILKRLEWTYNPEKEKKVDGIVGSPDDHESEDECDDDESEFKDLDFDSEDPDMFDSYTADRMQKKDSRDWWKLDSDQEVSPSK